MASHGVKQMRQSLNRKIMGRTIGAIGVLVVVCCVIMIWSMHSLSNAILLDTLQPMARQSAKTVEENIHMLADRLMEIASDTRLVQASVLAEEEGDVAQVLEDNRRAVLDQAREIYELHTIGLYDLEGKLMLGDADSPQSIAGERLFKLLQETDNLTTGESTRFQNLLGITMGMPVKQDGETVFYVLAVYKYDTLNDVLSNINIGNHGQALIINQELDIVAHPDKQVVQAGTSIADMSGDNAIYQRMITGETGAGELSISGENVFLAFSPVRGTQWSLGIQIPTSDYAYLTNQAVITTALAAIILLTLTCGVIYHLSRSISGSVRAATGRMIGLAEGDLQGEVQAIRSGDELELLTNSLQTTVGSINRYISEIQRVLACVAGGNLDIEPEGEYRGDFIQIKESMRYIIQSLNETMYDFNSAALRLADMAETLREQSSQLHQASIEQNTSAGQLVCQVSGVKESLGQVTQNTQWTKEKTQEIAQQIHGANDQMSALSKAMDNISNNAQEITKIAKAIEDIAFQTNILAINASVEAARAGTAGKGFSVVANEVKDLASKSAEAAKAASVMVRNTHDIISTGVALTADTAGSLRSISEVSGEIGRITDQLTQAVREQEDVLGEMEEKIETISAITDRNLQNANDTEHSSGKLAQEADNLQAKIQKFVLKGGAGK